MRKAIFISCSWKDREWSERFANAFERAGVPLDAIESSVPRGTGVALESSGIVYDAKRYADIFAVKIALILFTRAYWYSPYFTDKELPTILARKAINKLWVPIEWVSAEEVEITGLCKIQAVWAPDRPLADLPPEQYQAAIDEICNKLAKCVVLPYKSKAATSLAVRAESLQKYPENVDVSPIESSGRDASLSPAVPNRLNLASLASNATAVPDTPSLVAEPTIPQRCLVPEKRLQMDRPKHF